MILRIVLQASLFSIVGLSTIFLTTAKTANEANLFVSEPVRTDYVRGASITKPKKKKAKSPPAELTTTISSAIFSSSCGSLAALHHGLTKSVSPELRKLAQYEDVCNGALTDKLMIFTDMPKNSSQAVADAIDFASRLKEFAKFGIRPLVIQEPTTSKGNISFDAYRAGDYDNIMNIYFTTLKAHGITNQIMGTWVSFPEANIPEWDTTDAKAFVACVTKAITLQKQVFPSSKASILLESTSYPDGTWSSGKYLSLLPYVKNIPKGLVDSFGYQGFPWPDTSPDYNAAHFLRPGLAIEAASILGVRNIWLNTGSFGQGRADSGKLIKLSPARRQEILLDILSQAKKIKSAGYKVSINLFSQNKLDVSEGIDWSYWTNAQDSPGVSVFKTLVHNMLSNGIGLQLFDSTDD